MVASFSLSRVSDSYTIRDDDRRSHVPNSFTPLKENIIGRLMRFFGPRDAMRFGKTCKRHLNIFKKNELKLRPFEHIHFLRYPFLVSAGDEEFIEEELDFEEEEEMFDCENVLTPEECPRLNMITFSNSKLPDLEGVNSRRAEEGYTFEFLFIEMRKKSRFEALERDLVIQKDHVQVKVDFDKDILSFMCHVNGGTEGDAREMVLSYLLRRFYFDTITIDDSCRAPTRNFLAPLDLSRILQLNLDCNFVSYKSLLEILERCSNVQILCAHQAQDNSSYYFPKEFFEREHIRRLKELDLNYTRSSISQASILALKATRLKLCDRSSLLPKDLEAVLQAWKEGKKEIEFWHVCLKKRLSLKDLCRRFDGKMNGEKLELKNSNDDRLRLRFGDFGEEDVKLERMAPKAVQKSLKGKNSF